MQLKELVTTDRRFQKSVNLRLDIGDSKRLESYIPTRSSVAILKKYLKNAEHNHGENATILLGPYGKGKSHLLLILLAVLSGKKEELSLVARKIEKVDEEAGRLIRKIWSQKKKFLPVLISPTGNDLNTALLYALREALEKAGLSHAAPASAYTEADRVIKGWKKNYPEVYRKLGRILNTRQTTIKDLQQGLAEMDKGMLRLFEACYPSLTAGSVFQPMVQADALQAYQEISRELSENHGYAGIILIFDEFSKYIEGHKMDHFANDMKTLQDMCELANTVREQQISLILVAHKSIHEYEKGIHKTVKNAFKGVEGRLTEIPFVVTAQNNYELIADTMIKKEPEFSKEFRHLMKKEEFRSRMERSYQLPCFNRLFADYKSYEEIMVTGCFPLTPVCAYALLHISEKVAQNERTIFTFLTSREHGSLPELLKRGQEEPIGIDAIYDYFNGLFRESTDQPNMHNEWLKADYALKKAQTDSQKKIIKAIALIRMLRREEELPAQELPVYTALSLEKNEYQQSIEQLKRQEIIIYRKSQGVYAFKNNVGVDIEKEIQKEIAKQPGEFPVCRYLNRVSELEYVLPKQYNQTWNMTRYFQYEYMTETQFLQMESSGYLFEKQFADGKIIALVSKEHIQKEKIHKKLESLSDERIMVLLPDKEFEQEELLRRLAAVWSLRDQPEFLEDNKVLEQELLLYEEDMVFEINASIEQDFMPGNGRCLVVYGTGRSGYYKNEIEFNRCLSELCEEYYRFSPKVNHELLNIQNVAGQYLRARNKVVTAILEEQGECFETGTAPECMVYRAAFVRTGILGNRFEKDSGCSRIMMEIQDFFQSCSGQRRSFQELYHRLQGKDFGVRKGILPLFLAQKLAVAEDVPVIYLGKKELELNAETLNSINNFPQDYELYIEEGGARKEQYLRRLEKIWEVEDHVVFKKRTRWMRILDAMQKWYRSLPQYTMTTKTWKEKQVVLLRNLLKRAELNPREVLFERIPEILQEKDLGQAAERLEEIKEDMEQCFPKLQQKAADVLREVFQAGKKENLKACLTLWYQKQANGAKDYILHTSAMNFMLLLEKIPTNDDREIAAQISKQILDIYMEDWNDGTLELFGKELLEIKDRIEEVSGMQEQPPGGKTIILKDSSGKSIQKNYDTDAEDSTSIYLKNMIDEAMEEFGDTLEMNQKVAVLVEVLENLLQ